MEKRFDIVKNSSKWILSAIILMIISAVLFFWNLRLSIQFTWWMEITFDWNISDEEQLIEKLSTDLEQDWYVNPRLWVWLRQGFPSIIMEIGVTDDEQVDELSNLIQGFLINNSYITSYDDILEVSIIWPSIWDWMKRSAIVAIVSWLILIWIYMLFAFSWIRNYLSPWMLAIITMFTLLFDVIIPAGAYWILMAINPAIQVDLIFIIAALTIMGYSINDTIIIFDRIRENISNASEKLSEWKISYIEVFENSIWQTMRRSLATSISTLLVVVSMYIFAWWLIQIFAFTLMIWVIAGTFSSIFLAAPLAYMFAITNNSNSNTNSKKWEIIDVK